MLEELKMLLHFYEKMKLSSNIKPNNITYNSLIDCWVRWGEIEIASTLIVKLKINMQN